MRALWTIAFVLAVTGHVHAEAPQVPAAPDSESAVIIEDAIAEPAIEDDTVEDGDIAVEVDPQEANSPIELVTSAVDASVEEASSHPHEAAPPRIERIESTEITEIDQDDLPPSLRTEVAPRSSTRPPERVRQSPWKGTFGFGSGLALHLNARDEFQQGRVAPAYLHFRGGAVLPGEGTFRHAIQLGVSTNLSREGAYPSGSLALRQWVIVPSYILRVGLDSTPLPAWIATVRVGVPIVVSPDATVGAELAFGAQYFTRAGLAVFAELIYDVFAGGRVRDGSRSTHHLLTLEVGLQFELEVLP